MTITVDRIIHSKRRTLALIVERNGSVTVRAPMRATKKAIREFVERHAQWIERKQAEARAVAPESPRRYQPGESFLFLGRSYPLEIVRGAREKLSLGDSFRLEASAQAEAETVFRDWYRRQAARILAERVTLLAERYQLPYGKIRITSARTRWGSCSSKGTLSFTWRLVMTPPEVIDYVVVHELAHTVHHDHSRRFWSLVEKMMPEYRERRRQLQRYGREVV